MLFVNYGWIYFRLAPVEDNTVIILPPLTQRPVENVEQRKNASQASRN
jgi:hypothetical protein